MASSSHALPAPTSLPATTRKIGIIICSQRSPRAGPQIAKFDLQTLNQSQYQSQPQQHQHQHQQPHQQPYPSRTATATATAKAYELALIDLADHPLPMYDEPQIPSRIQTSSEYKHAHTRAWSEFIDGFAAFAFVTPQYNWGYPASIKNAIDYLYREWTGKPAMVVSYGGHGGGKAAVQLKQVLQGVRMRVVQRHVELMFPDREFMAKAAVGAELGLVRGVTGGGRAEDEDEDEDEDEEPVWAEERAEMASVFQELVAMLD